MDIILKGYAKMIIWINLRVRILGKRTVDFFIRDPNVNCNFGNLNFIQSPFKSFKVANLINKMLLDGLKSQKSIEYYEYFIYSL